MKGEIQSSGKFIAANPITKSPTIQGFQDS